MLASNEPAVFAASFFSFFQVYIQVTSKFFSQIQIIGEFQQDINSSKKGGERFQMERRNRSLYNGFGREPLGPGKVSMLHLISVIHDET